MKYNISRSIEIKANKEVVLANIQDFKQWDLWSPWSCLDPDSKTACTANTMAWKSPIIGEGNMQLLSNDKTNLTFDLNFIKPFKSHAKVSFQVLAVDNGTTSVVWDMHSSLPLFFFFWKKMLTVMISKDYDRGLHRLKVLSETGKVPVRLNFVDVVQDVAGFNSVGVSASSHMSNIAASMHESFNKLHPLVASNSLEVVDSLCFCDKMHITKNILDYTTGVRYKGDKKQIDGLTTRIIPNHQAIKVVLYGDYTFLADAWSGVYMHFRALKLKANKKIPPYEVYLKGIHNTDNPEEYVTEIYLPIR